MIKCTFEDGGKSSLRHVVVDALVLNDKNQVLLVKRSKGKLLEGGKWALAGGFVDRDETLEQAMKREIKEETGWEVKSLKLLRIKDSPNRPNEDRQNISLVYTCYSVKKTGVPDQESSEQRWFRFSDLPSKNQMAFDHFGDIEFYLESKE